MENSGHSKRSSTSSEESISSGFGAPEVSKANMPPPANEPNNYQRAHIFTSPIDGPQVNISTVQQGMGAQAMGPGPSYVMNQPQMVGVPVPFVMNLNFGPDSVEVTCPRCQRLVHTAVTPSPGIGAWLTGFGLAIFGCICGCCLIPCALEAMQVFTHQCPACRTVLGKYAGASSLENSESFVTTTVNVNRF